MDGTLAFSLFLPSFSILMIESYCISYCFDNHIKTKLFICRIHRFHLAQNSIHRSFCYVSDGYYQLLFHSINHFPLSGISFTVLKISDYYCANRDKKDSMRTKPINHLSNRNHEYCILHTIALIHITNQSIPTVFAILSSIVVKQDKSPFD